MPSTGLNRCNCGWSFTFMPNGKKCFNCGVEEK